MVIEEGGPNGHAAILARALGLPALGSAGGAVDAAEAGDEAVIDADEGLLVLRRRLECQGGLRAGVGGTPRAAGRLGGVARRPAQTADGVKSTDAECRAEHGDLTQLDTTGAEGIGLYRTEIAMLARGSIAELPSRRRFMRAYSTCGRRPALIPHPRSRSTSCCRARQGPAEENPRWAGDPAHRTGPSGGTAAPAVARPIARRRAGGRSRSCSRWSRPLESFGPRGRSCRRGRRGRPAPDRLSIGTMLEFPALIWQLDELFRRSTSFRSARTTCCNSCSRRTAARGAVRALRFAVAARARLLDSLMAAACAAKGGDQVPISLCGERGRHGHWRRWCWSALG